MAKPKDLLIAVSNVFIKFMTFENVGDENSGHYHTYDHATLITSGRVRYELLDGLDGAVISSKEFTAPDAVFVDKNHCHRMVALEPGTTTACIHALRSVDSELIPPESFIDPLITPDAQGFYEFVRKKLEKRLQPMTVPPNHSPVR
jgi:hypothetical protein